MGNDEIRDPNAFAEIYRELHALAADCFRRESPGHTLQPTALVHEAYLKLEHWRADRDISRTHFVALAARTMRRVLVDHARRAQRQQHGERVALDDALCANGARDVDVLDLEDLIDRLEHLDARKARVVEMRVFGGMTIEETAVALGHADSTVSADWRTARAWMAKELEAGGPDEERRR